MGCNYKYIRSVLLNVNTSEYLTKCFQLPITCCYTQYSIYLVITDVLQAKQLQTQRSTWFIIYLGDTAEINSLSLCSILETMWGCSCCCWMRNVYSENPVECIILWTYNLRTVSEDFFLQLHIPMRYWNNISTDWLLLLDRCLMWAVIQYISLNK